MHCKNCGSLMDFGGVWHLGRKGDNFIYFCDCGNVQEEPYHINDFMLVMRMCQIEHADHITQFYWYEQQIKAWAIDERFAPHMRKDMMDWYRSRQNSVRQVFTLIQVKDEHRVMRDWMWSCYP